MSGSDFPSVSITVVCRGSDAEARRHLYSFNSGKLAQVGPFAPDQRDFCLIDVGKTKRVRIRDVILSAIGGSIFPALGWSPELITEDHACSG